MKIRGCWDWWLNGMILAVLASAITFGGCSPVPIQSSFTLEPQVSLTRQTEGDLYSYVPEQVVSPGGKYLLAEHRDDQGFHMVAVSLTDHTNGDVILNTVGTSYHGNDSYVWQVPVGWMFPTSPIFLVCGRQDQGPHKDENGIAIMLADVNTSKAEEIGFIELESGYFRSAVFVEDESKIYIHVSGALWEFDLKSESLRLVKGNLPTYDGLFHIQISPTGQYAVYEMHEMDKQGIYILDTATGEERPLLPVGTTKSFLPQWSPDGKYIAAYTAEEKPDGANLPIWERYQVFEGEDQLLPMASGITIVTPEGKIKKTIELTGKVLAHAKWAQNSKTIGFLAGTLRTMTSGERFSSDERPSALFYESAMIVDILDGEEAISVADFQELAGFDHPSIEMVFVDPLGRGLYFVISTLKDSSLQSSQLWYGSKDEPPIKVCDGVWQFAGIEPIYGSHVVGVLSSEDKSEVWLLGPDDSRRIMKSDNPSSWTTILGYDERVLVVGNYDYSQETDTSTVLVYEMYNQLEEVE
jgi:hypothetical protein